MSLLAVIASVCTLLQSTPTPGPESAPPALGLRAPGPYVHVSPGFLAWYIGTPVMSYAWGVDAGYQFVRGRRFMAQVGGFLHHVVADDRPAFAITDKPRRWTHSLRLGPELRVGGGNERVFGYVVVRAGFHLFSHDPSDPSAGRQVIPSFTVGLGPGIQGALGPQRRFLVGFEPAVALSGPLLTLEPRLLLGWRF